MLRGDPRSSHAMTAPIGASKPPRFASTTQTDVFDSLAQQAFCLVSEIRPRFVVRNMLRGDPRSLHAKTTPIGASKPLRFASTTRTDVFDSLVQLCLTIREEFVKVSEIRPRFVVRNMLRHDPHSSHAKTTPIGASKPLRLASATRTEVSEIRPRFVVRNMLRGDLRSSHPKTTPIGASKPLRLASATRTEVSEIRPRFVVRNMLRGDPRSLHAKTTPIGASKPLRFLRSNHDLSSEICLEVIHTPPMPRRLQLERQNHSGSQVQLEPRCLTHLRNKSFASSFVKVSEIRPRFVVRNMFRGDPRSSHAKTTPIGESNPLRVASTTRTDVFDSLAQQVFCLIIREGF
ncbi:uncharacterized protein G2W53_010021 [Senna tora]|uniref:Uncharacterized protein n=1 Tax=Senna tora TaxID=362788 RepID=A0A834WYX4_9FABA|nr:uncharacterized protein G2W53_010021 [Senna tora]